MKLQYTPDTGVGIDFNPNYAPAPPAASDV